MKEKILKRERSCFKFLKSIPKDRRYVVVGGYAVSAFEFPRLSVDLDIAIPQEEQDFFERLIEKQGFKLSTEKSDIDRIYSGKFKKFIKKVELPISVDLLINSVKSRQTGTAYSFKYLYENSETREVAGWHPESNATVKVVDREMLIALKMNSMRPTDKRDIIVLCYDKPNTDRIVQHISRCPIGIIRKHIDELTTIVENPKYTDSIRGTFNISEDVYKKAVKNCKIILREAAESLKEKIT